MDSPARRFDRMPALDLVTADGPVRVYLLNDAANVLGLSEPVCGPWADALCRIRLNARAPCVALRRPEVQRARRCCRRYRMGPTDGAFIFEGRMVDAPVLRKARRIVELSDRV